jgi:hypothetical protein
MSRLLSRRKAVGKAVAKLVRRKLLDAGALADATKHPPERLLARRIFEVRCAAADGDRGAARFKQCGGLAV